MSQLQRRERITGGIENIIDLVCRAEGFTICQWECVVEVSGTDEGDAFPWDGEHGSAVTRVYERYSMLKRQTIA